MIEIIHQNTYSSITSVFIVFFLLLQVMNMVCQLKETKTPYQQKSTGS